MKRLKSLFKEGYISKVFALFSGGLIGQTIPFLLTPLLASYYSPGQFSDLGIFLSFLTVLTMFATMRLEHALLIPEDEHEVQELVSLSLTGLFLIALAATLVSFLFDVPFYYHFIGLGAFIFGFGQIGVQIVNRLNKNKTLVLHKSSVGPGTVLGQIILKNSSFGLIWGKLAGDIFSVLPLVSEIYKNSRVRLSLKRIKELLIQYKNFPTINALHGAISLLSTKAPVLVFGYMGLTTASGEFEMVSRIGIAPLTLICSSLYLAFSQKFSELEKIKSDVKSFFIKNLKVSLLLIILPLFAVCLAAPYLVPLVLGPEWANTGHYFLYMFPAFSSIVLTSPYVYVPQYYMKQGAGLFASICVSILQLLGLFSGLYFSLDMGIILFSFGTAIGNLGYLYFIYSLLAQATKNEETKESFS